MGFDPEEWLAVAEICCSTIPLVSRQALLRTASNRAYYAALLSLKQRIESAQGSGAVPAWGTHEAIKQAVRTGLGLKAQINHRSVFDRKNEDGAQPTGHG